MEVGAERTRHFVTEERPERFTADPPHDRTDEVAEGQRVIAAGAARFPPWALGRERVHHPPPVVECVGCQRFADSGEAGGVAQQGAHGQRTLAGLRELRPIARDGRVHVEQTALDQQVRAERGHRLGRREDVDDGVVLPRTPMRRVNIPGPQVDDECAVDRGGERRAHFSSRLEVCCERVPDRRKLWITPAANRQSHAILTEGASSRTPQLDASKTAEPVLLDLRSAYAYEPLQARLMRRGQSSMVARYVFRIALAGIIATLFVACMAASPALALRTAAQLLADLPLTDVQRQQVLRGELVTRNAHQGFDRELAVSMTFLMKAPREHVVQVLSEVGLARAHPQTTAFAEIHGEGTLDDFKNLHLTPNGAAEVQGYLAARPGNRLNLDGEEIATFTALAKSGDARAQVEAQLRQMLLARHRAYKTKGLAGIAPYLRDGGNLYQPADDLRRATGEERVVQTYLPTLHDLLLNYPDTPPPGFAERFFWVNYNIDDRPNAVLAHRMMVPLGDAYAVVTRQFYVSQSYNVVQEIAVLIPTTGGTVVFYHNRTSTDQAAGFGSGMKHSIGTAMMDKQIRAMFEKLRHEAAQSGGGQ